MPPAAAATQDDPTRIPDSMVLRTLSRATQCGLSYKEATGGEAGKQLWLISLPPGHTARTLDGRVLSVPARAAAAAAQTRATAGSVELRAGKTYSVIDAPASEFERVVNVFAAPAQGHLQFGEAAGFGGCQAL